MSKLNEIFHKRLDKMREELNSYIESHLSTKEQKPSTPIFADTSLEKVKGGVQEKFLSYMKLDDEDGEYYDDQTDKDLSLPPKKSEIHTQKIETPKRLNGFITPQSTVGMPREKVNIPDFLLENGKRPELDKVLEKKEESFSEMLLRIIDEKHLKDSDVYKRANIDRRLFSKLRSDKDYFPGKKTAISFCLALQLDVDEAKKLLATAGYTLSASSRFDLIIMYLIERGEYNIHFVNLVLDDYGEGTLSR